MTEVVTLFYDKGNNQTKSIHNPINVHYIGMKSYKTCILNLCNSHQHAEIAKENANVLTKTLGSHWQGFDDVK